MKIFITILVEKFNSARTINTAMYKFFSIALLLTLASTASAQTPINQPLKRQLDSVYTEDQRYRELLFSPLLTTKADSLAAVYNLPKKDLLDGLMKKLQATDSSNMAAVEAVFQTHGYPGRSLVGTPTNEAAFYVVQHSANIDRYLPLIKKAADENELPFKFYAMMLDRSLMEKGREQVYGTQVMGFETVNATTGKKEFIKVVWPIENAQDVNRRRKEAGFAQTVEENAKRLGVVYKPYTLQQVAAMQNSGATKGN